MIAIGFKGGASISQFQVLDSKIIFILLAGGICSLTFPFVAYFILSLKNNIRKIDAAAISAHYGSVSIVTFLAAEQILLENNIPYSGYIIAVLAIMESPAIISGLYLSRLDSTNSTTKKSNISFIANGATVVLIGSLVIAFISGPEGFQKMKPFVVDPFQGMLSLFLLDMGILVFKEIKTVRQFTLFLFCFAIFMPFIGAIIGLFLALAMGLDVGTGFLFIVLCASSSYIAVPAAMRLALPEANASLYLPLSLGVTFSFNIILGVSIYLYLAKAFL